MKHALRDLSRAGSWYEYFKTSFSRDLMVHIMASCFIASLKIVTFLSVDIHSVFADLSGQ